MLQDFVEAVKTDCSADKNHFNFYYVPDMIVRRNYSRKDYEHIIKLLNKVKVAYQEEKAERQLRAKLASAIASHFDDDYGLSQNGDKGSDKDEDEKKPIATITDEDLIPYTLFHDVMAEMNHKFDVKQ